MKKISRLSVSVFYTFYTTRESYNRTPSDIANLEDILRYTGSVVEAGGTGSHLSLEI